MLKRFAVSLLLVSLFASPLWTVTAAAQTPMVSGIPDDIQLAGIQQSVWRTFGPEGTNAGSGGSKISNATPMSSVAGKTQVHTIGIVIREFDTAEHAAVAFDRISSGADASLAQVARGGKEELTSQVLPGIGTQAMLSRLDLFTPETTHWFEYATVQRDEYVFFVSARGFVVRNAPGGDEVDTSLPTVAIATVMANNGAPSPDETVFNNDGTSTGGLWGFMPSTSDPVLMDLVPVMDDILYPVPDA